MRENGRDPQSVTLSVRVYRRMISTYPHNFRSEYSQPMLQVFRDSCRQAHLEEGSAGLLAVWMRTGLDYLKTMIDEYAKGGTNMTREKFIKLSGWALMLAGIVLIAGFSVGGGETFYDDPLGGFDGFYEYGQLILIPAGLFLFTFGMAGLLFRYRDSSGGLGKMGLVIAVIGSGLSFISAILLYAMIAPWMGPWWNFMLISFVGMLVGLSLFGISALRTKPLVRWNALPLLTAVWFPLLLPIQIIVVSSGGEPDSMDYYALVAVLFWVVGSIGLGYLLQKDSQPGDTAAGAA
jgi:hypothetical protein